MAEDIIRVLRVIEYIGPRDRVEETVALAVHGTKDCGLDLIIRAATIGEFPEILEKASTRKTIFDAVEVKHG